MSKENKAMIEMLLCAALWSTAGIFMKYIPWNGFVVAGIRSLIAGSTMAVYMAAKGYKLTVSRQTVTAGAFTALVYICFVLANKLTTAANAIVLQFTSPVFIVILTALFLHRRVKKSDLAVVLVTLGGIALFFFDQLEPSGILGNALAITAGLFMAGMYVCVGEQETEERYSSIVLGQTFTFLAGVPFAVFTAPVLAPRPVLFIFILGVLQLGIPYILYVRASRYCPPLACSLLGALEPLLNPVWVLIFYGEKPGIFALIGGIIVVGAISAWCIYGSKEQTA